MPTPAWIQALRAKAGHEVIMTTAVCAVIIDDQARILLQKRADKNCWALPGGILEPGEQLHEALAREVEEETGMKVAIGRLTGVYASRGIVTHLNGDQTSTVTLTFIGHPTGGQLGGADGESTEAGFFACESLPPSVSASHIKRIEDAMNGSLEAAIG